MRSNCLPEHAVPAGTCTSEAQHVHYAVVWCGICRQAVAAVLRPGFSTQRRDPSRAVGLPNRPGRSTSSWNLEAGSGDPAEMKQNCHWCMHQQHTSQSSQGHHQHQQTGSLWEAIIESKFSYTLLSPIIAYYCYICRLFTFKFCKVTSFQETISYQFFLFISTIIASICIL